MVGKTLHDQKFGDPDEDSRYRRLQLDEYLEIPLTNHYDVQYYGTLNFGEKEEPLTFIFDTGSEWLWVTSTLCEKTLNGCDNVNSRKYSVEESRFFTPIGLAPS